MHDATQYYFPKRCNFMLCEECNKDMILLETEKDFFLSLF